MLRLAGPLDGQVHLAVDHVAVDPDLLVAGQGPGVEPEDRALGRLDRPVAELHGDPVVEPLERQDHVDADPDQVAAPVLDRLDVGVDVADLRPGR